MNVLMPLLYAAGKATATLQPPAVDVSIGPFAWLVPLIVSLVAGAVSAWLAVHFASRRTFWMRFGELEKLIIDHPFLYPLWNHCDGKALGEANKSRDWKQLSAHEYLAGLSSDQVIVTLMFIELWADFVIESRSGSSPLALGTHATVLSDLAREVAITLDLFPADREASLSPNQELANRRPVLEGRNGFSYNIDDLRHLGVKM